MSSSPVFEMEVDKPVRIERLVSEYGHADKEAFLTAMTQITKKLGGQNFKEAKARLFEDDMSATIDILLQYYDKAYLTGLSNKRHRIRATVAWDGKDTGDCAAQLIAAAG